MAMKPISKIMGADAFWQDDAKNLRYIHHQFQDYGYRLALKLGDIQHKAIYIKLAKTTPKHLIEQAAAFASDYREELNKGKLFMWKLKKLREQEEEKNRIKDFSWQFVWSKTVIACDLLATQISKKEQERLPQYLALIKELSPLIQEITKPNLFDPLAGIGVDSSIWSTYTKKSTFWESRKQLANLSSTKLTYKKDPIAALIRTNKKNFNIVWLVRLWDLIPLESQPVFIEALKPNLAAGAIVVTTSKMADSSKEHWEIIDQATNGSRLWLYHQESNTEDLRSVMSDFELVKQCDFDQNKQAFIWRYLG